MKTAAWLSLLAAMAVVGCTRNVDAFGVGKLGAKFSNRGSISGKLLPFVPPTACGNGALDFTDGCGTTQYMVVLR